jgi:hypothetical protein
VPKCFVVSLEAAHHENAFGTLPSVWPTLALLSFLPVRDGVPFVVAS